VPCDSKASVTSERCDQLCPLAAVNGNVWMASQALGSNAMVANGSLRAALGGVQYALEHAAEDGGADRAPVQLRRLEQLESHRAGEIGGADLTLEEPAVDVGEGPQILIEGGLALVDGGIEHLEEFAEAGSEIAAVDVGAVAEIVLEGAAFEDAGVIGEHAEDQADEEDFKIVAGVAIGFEAVVEQGHALGGLAVDGVFLGEVDAFFVDQEAEGADVIGEIGEGEFDGLAGGEVVDAKSGEIGDDDGLREVVIGHGEDVFVGLLGGVVEIATE